MRINQLITGYVVVFCLTAPGQITKSVAAERALSGAWIQGGERCEEVFTRAGKSFSFKKPVNTFAPAFIISGNQVRTPNASCRIKGSKRSGDRHILALVCATSVAVDEAPARPEPLADGTLRRYLNAADKVGTKYERCS
jgi:hypothetical protein